MSTTPNEQSEKARVSVSRTSITVRPGSTAKFIVTVAAAAKDVPTSIAGDDQFSFYEISGDVVLTSSDTELRVPYLLVPRSNSKVTASASGSRLVKGGTAKDGTQSIKLRNLLGALDADADVYTWGLSDKKDAPKSLADNGYDVRAAGVQSFADGDDHLLVFAINTHKRWSNAAGNEYDVILDTDRDGTPDYAVFSYDARALRTAWPRPSSSTSRPADCRPAGS